MNDSEYRVAFERLQSAFANRANPTPFGKEFGELMWHEVKDLDAWAFRKLINGFIGENQKPRMSEVRAKVRSFKVLNPCSVDKKPLTGCLACHETPGYVFAYLRGEPGLPYVFRCHCTAGHSIEERYPTWNNYKEKVYIRA